MPSSQAWPTRPARRLVDLRPPADLVEHDVVVLAACRDAVLDQVRQFQGRSVEDLLRAGCIRLRRLDRCRQVPRLVQQCLLLVADCARNLLAERLLLGPEPFELRQRLAPSPVGSQQFVHGLGSLAPGALGGSETFGVVTDHSQIEHPPSLTSTHSPVRRAKGVR